MTSLVHRMHFGEGKRGQGRWRGARATCRSHPEACLDAFIIVALQFNRQMESKLAFWGSNQHNLLSSASNKSFNRPQCLATPFDITDLSASEKHIAFITADGSLYSYGVNIDGRLGVGGKADLKYSGQAPAKVKLPARAVRVRCGFSHVCVQLANDELYAWGLGDYGSLGTGEFKSKSVPTRVQLKSRVGHFSCGAMHSGFVDADGNIYTTGSNEYGELGVNKPEKIATPLLVNFSHKVKQIECGVFYTLLLTARGQVFGMGNNKYGQLGIGHKVNECHPTLIRELDNIVAIAAGYHSGAIDNQGNLYIWGSGSFGELLKPKKIVLPSPVDLIFIRGFFGVAISTRERRVFTWGNNTYGQLGRGNFESAKDPVEVTELGGIRLDNFACGVNFFLAASKDDRLPSALALAQEKPVHKNRFEYLPNEREERSPYVYASNPRSITPKREEGTRKPLNYQAGSSTFRVEQENREIVNRSRNRSNQYYQSYRSPVRNQVQVQEARVRSRSREDREIIEQEIRRSRSRNRNYEDLFISLSADYEALLARYKTMEDHLELKNRSLAAQKQELSMIYKEENDILREENALLKSELTTLRDELMLTQRTTLAATNKDSEYLKEEVAALNAELTAVKEQLKVALKKLVQAEEEAKATPKKAESKRIPYQVQREMQQLKDQNAKLNKELLKLKEEFRITIEELEAQQQESQSKDVELRQLRQKKSAIDYKEEYEYLKKDFGELSKDLKSMKDELKTATRQHDEIEEELAIKNIELKQVKAKKQTIENELKQEVETLNEELAYLSKEFKITKEQLKITLKKLDSTEEELAVKSLEVKDLKQKRLIYDATEELKLQILAQRDENSSLAKENKILKEQLRNSLRKEEETEEQLAIKTMEAKDLRQKLANKETQLQGVRSEQASLSKDNKELKESLKSSVKQLDNLEEVVSSSKYSIASLEKAVKSRQEEIKLLEKRGLQAEEEYKDMRTKKESEIQSHLKKIQLLSEQNGALKLREKELSDSLRESSKLNNEKEKFLGEKEKHITQITANHKKIENELYRTISVLEEEKERVGSLLDKTSIDKRQLEETLRINEQNFTALEKQYQVELSETYGNLVKLKEVQDLNQIRVGELKTIIDSDQKAKSEYAAEVELLRVQAQNLAAQKQELFKMIEQMRAKQMQDLQPFKDRIIQLENDAAGYTERAAQLEIQLSYQKDYHSKCELTIRELTDSRDQVCREQETLRGDLQREREKVKDLSFQVEKNKTFKKEIEVLTLQLQRVETSTKEYKREIEDILQQKEEIIKEQRSDLEKKQREVDALEQKYETDTGALQREVKDVEKKLSFKSKECGDLKKEMEKRSVETDNLKDALDKATRKLAFKNEELEKELKEHERTTEEFNNLRREHARLRSEKEDLEGKIDQIQHEKRVLEGKISDRKKEAELLQAEIRRLESTCDNLRKETQLSKKQLEESNWALEESNRVNDELSRANKEFAENEEQFTHKIADLEGRIFQLEDENRSYTPRYDALMQRNRELDERNRELSEMINKAIEIQAEAYKTNILKEVQINTGEILQQIKEQQEFKSRGRRKETPKDHSKLQIENLPASSEMHKAPGIISKIKDEPYNKLMNQKISVHKKKVSESAQKLAGILDIHGKNEISDIAERQSEGKEFSRTMNLRREEDYEKINSQMESLNQQKQDFMQKISSFAEKLKIL